MPKRILPYEDFREISLRALQAGATTKGGASIYWDVSGNCENSLEFTTTYASRCGVQRRYLVSQVRCRKCTPCLATRSAYWRNWMTAEMKASVRTWMITLTLTPERQSYCQMKGELTLLRQGTKWTAATPAHRHASQVAVASKEVTLWLKRVRERAQVRFRYCLVWEKHKSGLPHAHVLLHEISPDQPVRHRHVTEAWRWGFVNAKLVDADQPHKSSHYVSKYLSKSLVSRVRCSREYGKADQNHALQGQAHSVKLTTYDHTSSVFDL